MPEHRIKRTKSQENLEDDFAQALKVTDFQGFIKSHVANYNKKDLKKLRNLYKSAESEEEYKEMIERLADKLTRKVEGDFQKTFEQAVTIVEKEEKEIVKERQKQKNTNPGPAAGSPAAPSTHPIPPAPAASGDQKPVPPGSTGQQGYSAPAGQSAAHTPGDISTPSNQGNDPDTGSKSQTNASDPTNQHVSPPSDGTLIPSLPVNNRAAGPTSQIDPSAPANQHVSPTTGSSSRPVANADPQTPPNILPRNDTMSTKVESVFSHDGKSSKSSVTSSGSSVYGNNGAQEPEITHHLPPPEELEQEYAAYAEDFIRRNFKGLLDPNSPNFKETMRNAAQKAKEIMKKYDITPEDAKKLTKLALYDFAILCDDSWSMMEDCNEEGEDRITPMKDTLGRISEIATVIEPSGISVRFLNYEEDSIGWDNMKSRDYIHDRFSEVEDDWGGRTLLGTRLDQKIIQPMVIDKMRNGTFEKPLIVVVITDGQPFGEHVDAFKEAVIRCKESREVAGYGEAAVIFIISRVGSDKDARAFISGLKRNKGLREWVYCNQDRLDDNTAIMQRAAMIGEAQGDKEYAKKLLQVFLAALGQQTK
ncbi:uncharacterized protein DFL_004705 [Arthrobotrys flagrans]|uniref:VWFA domain-containing protein n=1 Tax=Arthrobotrys flagrans TaxID=97331 RepID=A0A437A5N3_ARTFL|nr:hypothetical protein DFL_004705 [Arthrobotrys flagrans]